MVITTNIKNLAWQSQVFAIYFVSAIVLTFKGNVVEQRMKPIKPMN